MTLEEAVALIEAEAKDGKTRNGKSRTARKPAKKAKATASRAAKKPAKKPAAKKPAKKPAAKTPAKRPLRLPSRQARREPQALRQTEAETGATDLAERSGDPRIHPAAPGKVGKREIARAFGIKGDDQRSALKELLQDLADEGKLDRRRKRLDTARRAAACRRARDHRHATPTAS